MRAASDALLESVIGLAIEVHRQLGPGLLEAVYELALEFEMKAAGIACSRQTAIDVVYKGVCLGKRFRVDMLVEEVLPLELKAVDRITDLHRAQLIGYLRMLKLKRGLLMNFNAMPLKLGIRRISI